MSDKNEKPWYVKIIGKEFGKPPEVDRCEYFKTYQEALKYQRDYNNRQPHDYLEGSQACNPIHIDGEKPVITETNMTCDDLLGQLGF